ncbi:anti-sigma factor family protein [Bacillus andreraoultii]|uniref:anti-sigma factor family protein n=1 Tax=Bacillus andreraoultii TaxID=1499685 RepID=UPI0009463C3D|nr:anti-sigma factor [Bacillus andreraoultii]
MNRCADKIIDYMHDYLDEEIEPEQEATLMEHLKSCDDCRKHFHELEKSIALVKSISHVQAPDDFTQKVMMNLPREKKKVSMGRWFSRHPVLTAASVFIIFMSASFFSMWNGEDNFSVTKNPKLVIENNTAIVPEGETIEGDIVVKNGNIRIEGKVDGDVTVINGEIVNGEKYMASVGQVTGDIEEINEVFEWLWYQMKKIIKSS